MVPGPAREGCNAPADVAGLGDTVFTLTGVSKSSKSSQSWVWIPKELSSKLLLFTEGFSSCLTGAVESLEAAWSEMDLLTAKGFGGSVMAWGLLFGLATKKLNFGVGLSVLVGNVKGGLVTALT